jgi:hypothetical protein
MAKKPSLKRYIVVSSSGNAGTDQQAQTFEPAQTLSVGTPRLAVRQRRWPGRILDSVDQSHVSLIESTPEQARELEKNYSVQVIEDTPLLPAMALAPAATNRPKEAKRRPKHILELKVFDARTQAPIEGAIVKAFTRLDAKNCEGDEGETNRSGLLVCR